MIFEFFVNNDIHNKHNNVIDNNTDYYKCKFYIDMNFWKNSKMFAVFTNELGYSETVELGQAASLLTCLVPQKFLKCGKAYIYVYSEKCETNKIVISFNNKSIRRKRCNVFSDIFENIDQKIDNIIYEDSQLKCYSHGFLIDTIYLNIDDALWTLKEDVGNKITEISEESTDIEYPSAKAVYEYVSEIIGQIEEDMLS